MSAVHPRISVNLASTRTWTLGEDIDFLKSVGVGAITVGRAKLGENEAAAMAAIREAGLRVACVSAGAAPLIESGEASLVSLKPAIEAAAALGAAGCYCVTGPSPSRMSTDEAYGRLVEALGPATDHARAKGVRLAIEHNSQTTRHHGFVHTLADAADLSREADVDICVELQNCWYERNLERLFRQNADRLLIVQISDFKVGEELRNNRRVLGDGSMPLEWLIGRMLDAGYQGYLDIEILGPAIEAEGYDSALRRSVDWLSERLTAWGV